MGEPEGPGRTTVRDVEHEVVLVDVGVAYLVRQLEQLDRDVVSCISREAEQQVLAHTASSHMQLRAASGWRGEKMRLRAMEP